MPLSAGRKPVEDSDPSRRTNEESRNREQEVNGNKYEVRSTKYVLRAIVFDFDGVIANSEPFHFRGYRDVLAAEGVVLTEADYYARYLGYDDVGAFERIGVEQGAAWTPAQIAALVARKALRLEELERGLSVLFPGAAAAVRRAAAAMP